MRSILGIVFVAVSLVLSIVFIIAFHTHSGLLSRAPPSHVVYHTLLNSQHSGKCPGFAEYIELHNRILAGRAAPRYVVSVSVPSGAADRISGIISAFYFALLSGRAFQILTFEDTPPFEWAYDLPTRIDTEVQHQYLPPRRLLAPLQFKPKSHAAIVNFTDGYPSHEDNLKYWPVCHTNNDAAAINFFMRSNLSVQPLPNPEVPHVLFASNRGLVYRLFHNPYHKEQLNNLGLHPENGFRCAFDFLFKPNTETLALAQPFLEPLKAPGVLKIGISIRTGDELMSNSSLDNFTVAQFRNFFDCAREIERTRRLPGQTVVWYLISDSLSLRRSAKITFGDKLLTDIDRTTVHIHCKQFNNATCNDPTMKDAMQWSAADLHAFRHADYHVVTRNSGFGMIGAWLSPNWNHIYALFPQTTDPRFSMNSARLKRSINRRKSDLCGVFDYDSLLDLATIWQGL